MCRFVVFIMKERNHISGLPNFPSKIEFLPRESWAFLMEKIPGFSSDLNAKIRKMFKTNLTGTSLLKIELFELIL